MGYVVRKTYRDRVTYLLISKCSRRSSSYGFKKVVVWKCLNTSSFSWGNRTILLNVRMNKVVPISRNMCHDGLGIG